MQLLNAIFDLAFRDQDFAFDHWSHNTKNRFTTIIAEKIFFRHKFRALEENTLCLARVAGIALRRICNRASGMMKRACKGHVFGVFVWLGEDLVPEPEAQHHFQWHRDE